MLKDLTERHGEGAVLTVRPYVLDSGETRRWVVEIDGAEALDIDVRINDDADRPDAMTCS